MKIFPSVMAKNQAELNSLLKKLQGVSKELHLDVADGRFVPSKSLWFSFRLSSKFTYNAHLMINDPIKWIKKNGRRVSTCIVHEERIKDTADFISWMKKRKKKIAFALKPGTRVSELKPYLKDIDIVLILTVHPGFYGAKYLKLPLKKIQQIKKINPKVKVMVDGGMNPKTIDDAIKAGANNIVSGSFISKSDNPLKAIRELRSAGK